MKHGKFICNTLKAIRLDIARANGIEYSPCECHHKGDCAGTCPACESEMRYLENEIDRRRLLGKAALVAGVSLAVSSLTATAANSASQQVASHNHTIHANDTTKRFETVGVVEQMPHFRGGDAALMKYLSENIQYPPEAVKDKVQGRVVVQFMIEKTGEIGEVKVVSSVREDLDAEAVRVVKTLPKFYPGYLNGKVVSMWYTLPVTFVLTEEINEIDEE